MWAFVCNCSVRCDDNQYCEFPVSVKVHKYEFPLFTQKLRDLMKTKIHLALD